MNMQIDLICIRSTFLYFSTRDEYSTLQRRETEDTVSTRIFFNEFIADNNL